MKTTARKSNWPKLLAEYLRENRDKPFAWGSHDCALFTAGWVERLTGHDLAADLRGKYSDDVTALKVLRARGGLQRVADSALCGHGFAEIPVAMAHRGDVVLLDAAPYGHTLGICEGARSWFASPLGLVQRRTLDCVMAWRVA